ncbi:Urea amidohydrolase (urease) beta subunit [Candidatus Blochmanniella floridana]|uniref:Urease subunit beta n=1 Tax=Blochmanniella floridana TaxID=203907 RepID=URE2_BLOFL|nr:RecName: Full=Urease subunit beta; AltName: Full=Urea amidohydrolase subunit beta [Candidatus Blochmannia floridanus]CAD83210.1 Urea amidohydrolase (urease) beta subunit [Candidatus Blochmannia floridanus]
MIPGELHIADGIIELNVNREKVIVMVINNGDRPIQVGSHFHFYEVNNALFFNRNFALGFRLNVPSGTSIRFEPGQTREVELVRYSGELKIVGFCKKIMGKLSK